ncbi:XK-related protein 8 [Alligator mississippiensis]|uniref:XK-related protein n=1 Tax=Alligator mississippiensis TaxID=8496 RepID=A0A151PGB3_ALLMI|nr:XK-related protein 8 [Alligator mississippiensis]
MARPDPRPARLRRRDLLLMVLGTAAFLADLGTDLWMACSYVRAGHRLWGVLVLALLALSSLATQLFSWAWHHTDPPVLRERLAPGACLALLHLLQLGYLSRCVHAVKVGWQVCKPGVTEEEKAYVLFLSHDISMLRLFETFLETAPQLTFVLYVILQTNEIELFQGFGICTAFLCVAWALLDYHQSLRCFLREKYKLDLLSSFVYFTWNFFLTCPRILSVALFATLFPHFIALHVLSVWAVMVLWVWLQKTNFMDSPGLEWFYRATVGMILYFCWFNVAKGRTIYRSIIYHVFILVDCALLVASWAWYNSPLDEHLYPCYVLPAALVCYFLGLLLKGIYYKYFHPTMQTQHHDEVDAAGSVTAAEFRAGRAPVIVNKRMYQLVQSHFAASSLAGQSLANGVEADALL